MDNLQTQTNNGSTGNPQAIGSQTILPQNTNLQGIVGNQLDLSKLNTTSLKVIQCTNNCTSVNSTALVPKSNYSPAIVIFVAIIVSGLIVWRLLNNYLSSGKTQISGDTSPIRGSVINKQSEIVETAPTESINPKTNSPKKKTKKTKRKKPRR